MAAQEELRWFWHLSGELEFAQLDEERRSLHRAVGWGTALMAKELLRTKGSEFRRKPPEPAFAQLMTFLRRLRWGLLWQLASDQERASPTATRAEMASGLLAEASRAYPSTPAELERAAELFDWLGYADHADSDPELGEQATNLLRSGFEDLMGLGLLHDWLAEIEGFAGAREADAGWFNNLAILSARYGASAEPNIREGLSSFGNDEGLARAIGAGYGNFAVCCLIEFEGLEPEEIVALNVEDLRVDGFGALVRVQRRGGGFLGGGRREAREQRITPYTRIAIEQNLEGRLTGPLLVGPSGDRLTETLVNVAYLQAAAPERISGDQLRL